MQLLLCDPSCRYSKTWIKLNQILILLSLEFLLTKKTLLLKEERDVTLILSSLLL